MQSGLIKAIWIMRKQSKKLVSKTCYVPSFHLFLFSKKEEREGQKCSHYEISEKMETMWTNVVRKLIVVDCDVLKLNKQLCLNSDWSEKLTISF